MIDRSAEAAEGGATESYGPRRDIAEPLRDRREPLLRRLERREAGSRKSAVAAAWTADGSCTGPLAGARDHGEPAGVSAAVRERLPGFSFVRTGTVEGHHDTARFRWELRADEAPSGGESPVAGSDVITLDEDGPIRTVLGFLDRALEGAARA